jgi:hypothetical protein
MKRRLLYAFLILFLAIPSVAISTDSIPNVNLQVTVQQKEEGKLSKGFHVLELTCWQGNCSLSTVTLNQCFESGSGKKAFFPKVQYSSTWMGNLKVRNEGKGLVVQETGHDMFGDYVSNFRFDYRSDGKGEIITKLTGFSGGYVKNSALLKQIITTDYVPLQKANQIMKLDCDALLPGIDKQQ